MNKPINTHSIPDLDTIFREFNIKISHLSRRMIDNEEIAREAAQETWLQIVKGIDTFRGESELSTWIYSIAKRTIIRYAVNERKYGQRALNEYFMQNPVVRPDFNEVEEKLWVKEICDKCLTAILHCLNNEDRLLFLLRDILDVSYSQLVDIFDIEEQTLRKRVSRTRVRINRYMSDQCYLVSPSGSCRCNNQKHVRNVNFREEYTKVIETIEKVNHFREINKLLPKKDYWLELQKKTSI